MKNFKKILACVMTVATLSSVALVPISSNAIILKDDNNQNDSYDYIKENSIKEAILVINDGEYSKEYYLNTDYMPWWPIMELDSDRNIIQHDNITDEKFNEVTSSVDISKVENIVNLGGDNTSFYLDCGSYYTIAEYNANNHSFIILETTIEKENTTIGESTSITEFTVGESTYPRGDINLDGKVNTVDLLMLKKYLLGLMEW